MTEFSDRLRRETLKTIQDFTLFDDTFMSIVFDENPKCTEYVLGAILGKRLKVIESHAQREIKSLKGRSVRLDIKAVDSSKRLYNIEVQRENSGAKPRRARYNGSMLDANCGDSGRHGENLPETYVIFITEKDYWKKGFPVYRFERKCAANGADIQFDDGLHIVYVNGAYKGNDRIGDLMHDFSCANPDDIKSGVLRESVSPYKKDEKEAARMCKKMERLNRMAIEEDRELSAVEFLKNGVSAKIIAKSLNIPEKRVRELKKEIPVKA